MAKRKIDIIPVPVDVKEVKDVEDYSAFDLVVSKRVEHLFYETKSTVADIFGVSASGSRSGCYSDFEENKKADAIALLLLRKTIEKIERESLKLF